MKNCNIVKDILPLYVDKVLSDESKDFVDEHIKLCTECREELELLKKPFKNIPITTDEETVVLNTVRHKLKRKKYVVVSISVFLTVLIFITGIMVYQNVGVVHDYFSPTHIINMKDFSNDWELAESNFSFDSRFYSRKVVNDIHSDSFVSIRILDSNDNTVIDDLEIEPGAKVDISELEYNMEYKIYIKSEARFIVVLRFI